MDVPIVNMGIRMAIRTDTAIHIRDTHTLPSDITGIITTAIIAVTTSIIIQNLMDTMAETTANTAIMIMIIQSHTGITTIGIEVTITAKAVS